MALFSSMAMRLSVNVPNVVSARLAGATGLELEVDPPLDGLVDFDAAEQVVLKSWQQFLKEAQSKLHWQLFFRLNGVAQRPAQEFGFPFLAAPQVAAKSLQQSPKSLHELSHWH